METEQAAMPKQTRDSQQDCDAAKLAVEWTPIERVHGSPSNPRDNDAAVPHVAASIKRFGWQQPIVARADGEVIAGNTRLKAAHHLGLVEVPVVWFSGTDLDAVAYQIADNRTGELATWDEAALSSMLTALRDEDALDGVGYSAEELQQVLSQPIGELRHEYTSKMDTPIYEITGECPEIHALIDDSVARRLVKELESSQFDEDVRRFLEVAASRHIKFNYALIAELYAHATPEVQRAMEASALVIVDVGQAIERGWANLGRDLDAAIDKGERDA
jgi:hypothetical protein